MASTATEGKVKFNLKNVHIAPATEVNGVITYETPFQLKGAVSVSLEAQGELNKMYADGIVYYTTASNNGYEGDLEIALITDEFRTKILGEEKDETTGIMWENVNVNPKIFAIGFEIEGDQRGTRFWFLKATCTRPTIESETTEDAKEPGTDTLTISCAPNEDGYVRAKTTPDVAEQSYSDWFKSVPTKTKAA